MQSSSIVYLLDEDRQSPGDIGEGLVAREIDFLDLQRLHEALRPGIMVGIADAAHRSAQAGSLQRFAIQLRRVLAAPVGVMDAAGRRPPACDSGLQGGQGERRVQALRQGVTDDVPAAGIKDDREVAKALRDADVGEVRDPDLIEAAWDVVAMRFGWIGLSCRLSVVRT